MWRKGPGVGGEGEISPKVWRVVKEAFGVVRMGH